MSANTTLIPDPSGTSSIAFVDSDVSQSDTLIQGLQADKVFLLNAQTSAIEQITQTLGQYQNLESVHIFSHGSENALQFANGYFSQANLSEYEDELAAWGKALSPNGDLLFYGCNLAAGGDQFIQQISQLTQADVAASDDITGHTSLDGNWDLERSIGSIEAAIAVDPATQASYQGQLKVIEGTADADGLLEGTAGDDILKGLGGIDALRGNGGVDLFVLGDENGGDYDQAGFSDYADILDFTIGEDQIQLNGVLGNYTFQTVGNNTWIYKGDASNGELVADIFNTNGADITGSIEFVDGDTPPPPPPPPTPGDTILGTAGSDGLLEGAAGDDTLKGLGGIDSLRGNAGADVFVLGDETGGFYDKVQFSDYADILDFMLGEDLIRLNGVAADYSFQTVGNNTWIYKGSPSNGELVADVFNTNGADITNGIEFVDGDTPPPEVSTFALKDSNTVFVNEAAGVATVTAVRTGGSQAQATVEYTLNELGENSATGDVDFIRPTFDGRPNTGQIVFAPGATEASFTITIINDTLSEGNETFAIGLQNPNGENTLGAPRTKLVTILDDDVAATISLSQATLNVAESNGVATVSVQRSGNIDTAASATYTINDGTATLGQDYGGTASGTINFAVGQTSQTVAISILDDVFVEANETFTLTLDGATNANLGAQLTTTISILDNDLELGNLARTTAVTGFVQPTTLDWTPDGRYMLVAEKGGLVKVVDNGVLRSTPLINISDQVNGTRDRGLLGLAIHPEFLSNPYVYLLYTYDPPETAGRTGLGGPDGNGNRPSRMVRVTVNPNTMVADPNSLVVMAGTNSTWEYTSSPTGNSTGNNSIAPSGIVNGTTITAPASEIEIGTQDNDPNRPGLQNQNIRDYLATDSESHSIGDLEFGADGYLYLTNGDGTSYNFVDPRTVRVQDVNNLSGKLLRIDPITGEGVATNPFYNGDGDSNQSKVFYSGLRNPFRFAFDPITNLPVIGDVGWNSFEEINTGPAGSNFGWPYIEGPNPTGGYRNLAQAIAFYNNGNRNNPGDAAAVLPLLPRSHGAPDNANAITVGDFYNSNTLMFGDVNNGTLYAATLDNNRQVTNVQVFDSGAQFVVDMKMGPDGKLYGVNLVSGSILRWEPDNTPPTTNTYNGNTYVVTNGLKSWEQAQAEAESLGGNLVTINDAAEETWLKQTFGGTERFWIGLTDRQIEGQYRWVSGEAVTYTNWAPGEPNNFGGDQDFGVMNFGATRQWDDDSTSTTGNVFRGIIEI
ncbi:DUF4347 domain-containing protein [Leptolyngbya cf. ectocarpi LEGE 11479]|uniref:DUF4347 domain-containing protein n=1 Tax=Leptolyngbya cf. ectocarpi LEGE 11479 TaxID=1828722 RepID=A0A929F6M9_LEPEC|nr:DUF4347 domain-containing protein [Leptolyngbya ectocarpi]MBE9068270.1 DUF4347 domain-containing protein [Leptolyngbya cf. ectocarpi LEGE 11479]